MESDDESSSVEGQYAPRFTSARTKRQNKGYPRMHRRRRNSTGSTSGISSSGSVASFETEINRVITEEPESNADIFFIYNPVISIDEFDKKQAKVHDQYRKSRFRPKASLNLQHEAKSESEQVAAAASSTLELIEPVNYSKHSNLEVQNLSFQERLHLARIHYLTIPNGIRLALIIFCLAWFIYNAITIFKEYLEFGTVIYMEYRPPKVTLPPAISICTHCIMCGYKNELLEQMSVLEVVKERTGSSSAAYTASTVADAITEMNDLVLACGFRSTVIPNLANDQIIARCNASVPTLVSFQEGRKCFTFFSDIDGQMSRANVSNNGMFQMEFERFPVIQLVIAGKLLTEPPEDNSLSDDMDGDSNVSQTATAKGSAGIYMAFHDPTQQVYMNDIPMHRIQPGAKMDVRFQKKVETLMPPPYTTRCFNYDPFRNSTLAFTSKYSPDLSIYRSRGECFQYCIWHHTLSQGCINIYSIFQNDLVEMKEWHMQRELELSKLSDTDKDKAKIKFCARNNHSLNDYLTFKQQCIDQCNPACNVETYNIDPNVLDYGSPDGAPKVQIKIQWAPEQYTYIVHKEKLDWNEFLGTLGGHAHIWLGLSVIHVIRYILNLIKTGEFLPETSCCCVIYWWKSMIHSRKRYPNY